MLIENQTSIRKPFLLLLVAGVAGYALVASAFPTSSQAQALIANTIQNEQVYAPDVLNAFYQQRGMDPVWLRGQTSFQPRAEALLNLLDASWTQGLNPENYHIAHLHQLMTASGNVNRSEFDMLLSDAVVRYARDLTGMRGQHDAAERSVKYWRQPMEPKDILEMIASSADPVQKLKSLEPSGKLYQALRAELVDLTQKDPALSQPIAIKGSLKPGNSHAEVPKLRQRFGLAEGAKADSKKYDDELASKVMAFQREYGLKADGVIGAGTLAALNRSDDDKKMQIIANMERLRWMDQSRPDRYVLVNIPSASLWAVENGAVALEMPVIVGKTARPTYSFKAEITGVRFNPNWTVPPTIKQTDFLPMLRQDPYALTKKGIKLVNGGQEVDPGSVDWHNISSGGLSRINMVQNPGDDNPLGKVRVIMENPYNIYLHDTNHRNLFAGDARALSSGCIRLSQPEKMADFILKQNDGWSWDNMKAMIDSGRMRDVKTAHNLPVYITYQTIWLDAEGKLVYGPDFYGQDKVLANILKKANEIHFPQVAERTQISL